MSRKLKEVKEIRVERPEKAKITAEESLKRMEEFANRKEKFIATVRKS